MQIVAIMLKYLNFLRELCLFGQLSGLDYKNHACSTCLFLLTQFLCFPLPLFSILYSSPDSGYDEFR